ncbi:unnamed protein product [Adineta ricciae]|uniref:Uncharacterized protein n=1 Tax=Adineta ricciae TaxID=249248 RepID=A0A813R4S9_ADIRI|nr:unnamed protein product [Adineta ricciae]
MTSYCRDIFLCLIVVMVCFTYPQAQVNSMETSSTDMMNITISNKNNGTEKHFDVENATRTNMSELTRRYDDTDVEETEKKPKAKEDPYTKNLLETLKSMRENPQGFNIKKFLAAVNKTNELRKSTATTTTKPEKIDKSDDHDDADEVKTSTTTETTDNEHEGEDTDEEKTSTTVQSIDDEHEIEGTDEEKTSTTTETVDDDHDREDTDEEKTSTTTENTDDEHDHEGTDEETTSTTTTTTSKPNTNGEYYYGGNDSSACTCKTSLGVCYPIGAHQCLFNNGAQVVRCDLSGNWLFFKACPKSCEWKGGNIAVCID